MHNFMSKITDVIVKGISLVMKWNTPAVPHAQTKFAIFKSDTSYTSKFDEIEKKFNRLSIHQDTGTVCGPCGVDEK